MTLRRPFDPDADFTPDAPLALALEQHGAGCRCALHGRRLFGAGVLGAGLLAGVPAWAREGVQVKDLSTLGGLVPAEEIEQAAAQQYRQLVTQAQQQRALAPPDHPQLVRLRAISQRLIPFSQTPNLKSAPRSAKWQWEVNLIGSKQINAFCMPGGKIAFYTGILEQLKLTDDEVAIVMGHENAHALREHARARIGKSQATRIGANVVSSIFGLGNIGNAVLSGAVYGATLKFSRDDESEADKVGLELAARAGYNPQAGVALWQKMAAANKGAPPEWLSTHPAGTSRIREIEALQPDVQPLYAKAPKPTQRFDAASAR